MARLDKAQKGQDGSSSDPLPPPPPPIGEDFAMPAVEIRIPDNQLKDVDLDEEIAKMLTANNPEAPKALVRFIQKERAYKPEAMIVQTMTHYATDGWLLHHESEEATKQQDMHKQEEELQKKFMAEVDKATAEPSADNAYDDSKELRNQFNFSERAAQTSSLQPKDKATITEPPPTMSVTGTCCQSVIYDAYVADQERMEQQDRMAKMKAAAKKGVVQKEDPGFMKDAVQTDDNVMESAELALAAKVLERMVNQNTYVDIAMDFKYWDDASDQFKSHEGTLLPLWKFSNERARKKTVTAIAWDPKYEDMFGIGYGSYDFLKPTSGLICIFSLANPTYPEYSFATDSGVLSIDFHPSFTNLLAVGCYNGTVLVFDVARKVDPLIYKSSVESGTHSEPVWQVAWEKTDAQKALQFYSTSSDGKVLLWELSKKDLKPELAMQLRMQGCDEEEGQSLAGGCCFDFNKNKEDIYIVGTEQGFVHKCSKMYSSEYLASYAGHNMAVYSARWNLLHPDVFLSASADWTVKLWDSSKDGTAIKAFDMSTSVGDIAWAPYSSTVFAVCMADGKVSVYDLAQHKHEPLCRQKVVKNARLTKIVFNPKHPILLVGDDRGCVTTLKLSPNLRKNCGAIGKEGFLDKEKQKLDAFIEVALKSRHGDNANATSQDS